MNGSAANGKADGPVQEKEHKSVGNINASVYLAYFRNLNKIIIKNIKIVRCFITKKMFKNLLHKFSIILISIFQSLDKRRSLKRRSGQTQEWTLNLT